MDVKIDGLDDIVLSLNEIPDNLIQNLGKACALVEGEARRKAPKRTGDLKRSIESKIEMHGNVVEGVIFSPLEYAPYVCYGTGLFAESGGRTDVPWAYEDEKTGELIWTKGQHPQPYMRPALNENRQKIINLLQRGLSK